MTRPIKTKEGLQFDGDDVMIIQDIISEDGETVAWNLTLAKKKATVVITISEKWIIDHLNV